jgi:sugar/nucleoside kinase (ribokinase family)
MPSAPGAPSALLVGSITRDLAADGSGNHACPGGVVHHGGLALARLGFRVRIVTRVCLADADELLTPLRDEGAEVRILPSEHTTTYLNDYTGPVDRHELRETSDPIAPEDVPAAWRDSDVVQLGPLHPRDLLPATAQSFAGLVGIDLQGLFRATGGAIVPSAAELRSFCARARVVQVSEAEIGPALAEQPLALAQQLGRPELVVTRGARGATLVCDERAHAVSAARANGAHLVGAGDVLLAAHLALRALGHAPLAAARGASAICAAKITHGLVPRGLDLEEIAA